MGITGSAAQLPLELLDQQQQAGQAGDREDSWHQPGHVFAGTVITASDFRARQQCSCQNKPLLARAAGEQMHDQIADLERKGRLDRCLHPPDDRLDQAQRFGGRYRAGRFDQRLLGLGVVGLQRPPDLDHGARRLLGDARQEASLRPAGKFVGAVLIGNQGRRIGEEPLLTQRLEPLDPGQREEVIEGDGRISIVFLNALTSGLPSASSSILGSASA